MKYLLAAAIATSAGLLLASIDPSRHTSPNPPVALHFVRLEQAMAAIDHEHGDSQAISRLGAAAFRTFLEAQQFRRHFGETVWAANVPRVVGIYRKARIEIAASINGTHTEATRIDADLVRYMMELGATANAEIANGSGQMASR